MIQEYVGDLVIITYGGLIIASGKPSEHSVADGKARATQ